MALLQRVCAYNFVLLPENALAEQSATMISVKKILAEQSATVISVKKILAEWSATVHFELQQGHTKPQTD
jgi:hypothetical protein